jgi:ribosomal protein S18 acetylase RimI-like enzyme
MRQLLTLDQLSPPQLADLDTLCVACQQTDGNFVALYKHLLTQKRPLPCNFLYYEDDILIGFLTTFFFLEDTCEVALMVAPTHRKQGLASHLLAMALPLIQSQNMRHVTFSSPNAAFEQAFKDRGFEFRDTEYQMRRTEPKPVIARKRDLTIRAARETDLAVLVELDSICFPTPQPHAAYRFHQLIHDSNYQLFVAIKNGVTIGKAHISFELGGARFTDIAVRPSYQGRGFGSTILTHCINYCVAHGTPNICLDVEAINQQALQLYTHRGFNISNAYDFWTAPIEMVKSNR